MKSCLIANPADINLDVRFMPAGTLPEEDRFVTVPMIALSPLLARQIACADRFATLPLDTLNAAQVGRDERADHFATEPVASVAHPVRERQAVHDEELYTSFEAAISARAARVSRQLSHLPLAATSRALPSTDALPAKAPSRRLRLQRFWRKQRRALVLACLGLGLLLAGFDLMGLLILVR